MFSEEGPSAYATIKVHDEQGELLSQETVPNLWTDQLRLLLSIIFSDGSQSRNKTVTDRSGSTHTIECWHTNDNFNGGIDGGFGVFCAVGDGSGSTPTPARGDHQLANQVGSDANPVVPNLTADKLAWTWGITNNSGGAWTVRELGIMFGCDNNNNTVIELLISHIATSDHNVPDGSTVTVTWTIEMP